MTAPLNVGQSVSVHSSVSRQRTDFCGAKEYSSKAMPTLDTPKTIGELIDRVEWLREELFTIQRALEKMEHPKTPPFRDGAKKR
jgi:hypothetical protein